MPLPKIGQVVKVIRGTDETFDYRFLGKHGEVVGFDYECGCGQTPGDPMIAVKFGENTTEEFWREELK